MRRRFARLVTATSYTFVTTSFVPVTLAPRLYTLGLISAVISVGGGLYFARGDTPIAFSGNTPIGKLKNLGPKSAAMLEKIGIHTREELEEERRLFYVGITRAKSDLRLSYRGKPSRFLIEAGLIN